MVGRVEGGDEGRVGLFLERDQLDPGAAGSGAFDEEGGVAAFAGDHHDGLRRSEVRREESGGDRHGGSVSPERLGLKPALGCHGPRAGT